MSMNSQDDFEAIQNDVEEVEQRLNERRGLLFSSANGNGARALFDSIGSALGNIRERLQEMGCSPANAQRESDHSTESLRALSQRLETAELSHSTRMPLNLLQTELSRRDLTESLSNTIAAARSEPESPSSVGSRRSSLRRQSSALLASRNRDESTDSPQRIESPISSSSVRNLAETSFASSRNLAASIRTQGTALPTLSEDLAEEEDGSERGLLVPDSAQKQRTSMRWSMKIIGDDVVRRLSDVEIEEKEEDEEETPPTSDAPTVGLYTWGSLGFSSSGDNDNDDEKAEGKTYRLFGTSDDAKTSASPRHIPTDTRLGRSDIISMSASETHCAFVTSSGRLITCGNNTQGAVDPSRRDSFSIPRPTHLEAGLAITRIKKVSCGINHTAVVTENKSAMTWGFNGRGQLGHRRARRSNTANFIFPKAFILGGGRRAENVVCCDGYTLVLTKRMEAFVCGGQTFDNDHLGEQDEFFPLPEQNAVLCGLPLVGIAAGLRHLVVWTAHGTAYAWGGNDVGQCGREYPRELKVPVPIDVPKSSLSPFAGGNSESPVSFSRLLKNWNVWASDEPLSLASDVHVVDVACGKDHTILVTDSGRLLVCGSNTNGQLGVSGESTTLSKVQSVSHPAPDNHFESVQAGSNHTVLLDDGGLVWEMGNGDPTIRKVPTLLDNESQICSIMSGGSINFAVIISKSAETPPSRMPSMPLDNLMNAIRSEHEQKKDEEKAENYLSSIEDLNRGTENLFRSPSVMNSLFVDPEEIDHMYKTLINGSHDKEMKQQIVSSIERGMLMGLKSMVDSDFESVRFLLLYLQCPLWRHEDDENEITKVVFDPRGDLLFLLCESILGLPFEGYKAFLAWSATVYGKKLFVPLLVKPLIQQLNYRLVNSITHGIPMIAGVLRWLHTVNERSDESLARWQDFYCTGIDDMPMEALFQDLESYQMASNSQRSSNFFIAAHPFLMSPSVKQKLLQVEHQMSMVAAAQAEGVSFDETTREYKFQPYFVLAIDRKHLLPQTLQAVAKASTGELRKGLKVVFKGEDGVDAGGVTKEFFQLLCEQLFDVNTGMWTTSRGSNNETWFNSDCTWNSEGYYLVGVLCGLAVYNSVILDVHFPHAIYRKLLGLPLGMEDLIDEDVRRGLKSLLDYEGEDVEYIFCLDFEVSWMHLGQERKKELKPGGSNIAVTSENKEEYVMLYVKWLLVDSIAAQYDEFERGFSQVMEDSSLNIFLAEELELLVTGTPDLDFYALQKTSDYEGGYDENSAVVKNIWKWIQSASLPTQEKFLKFCTGSSKGPIGGLGKMPFKIQRAGPDSAQLPTSHTCFNTLIVPDYGDDYEKLADRLGRAVIECEGFGLQ
eukprot:CAMPEP_0116154204 /NCGR_PEP_ID=MMETSP0329-20121206/21655_1 /TAXON_ID=697910 /ORGANISM="Pseudo-nitzschia arenysensis, Strain B593" /LENGTH=1345 /DNA_ID=CAMNT_0003651167 /DNA_START=244 /DNA_END=4282 /DNA_ORIENTATION=+